MELVVIPVLGKYLESTEKVLRKKWETTKKVPGKYLEALGKYQESTEKVLCSDASPVCAL